MMSGSAFGEDVEIGRVKIWTDIPYIASHVNLESIQVLVLECMGQDFPSVGVN